MDKMYEFNQEYFKELTMYIIAESSAPPSSARKSCRRCRKRRRSRDFRRTRRRPTTFASMIGRFEKRLHDLELTRIISIQMSPQIRLIQNNDLLMSEKIQTAIVNTIPLWKSQMVLALSLHHSRQRWRPRAR